MRGIGQFGKYAARWVKQFVRSERANTAMIFALASVSLLTAGGAGIDLSRVVVAKTRLAGALDAAALAVGTANGLTTPQMQTMAQQYFDANYPPTALGSPNPVNVAVNGQVITLTVTGSVPTTLLQIIHIPKFDLSVSNDVVRSVTKLRVALVLDNTGSMNQTDNTGTSKISALKTATHQLLTQLQNAAINPGDVQVSLVPFSLDVNLGSGNVGATWIDWLNFDAAPPNVPTLSSHLGPRGSTTACPFGNNTSPYGYTCTSSPVNGSSTVSNIPTSGTYRGYICPSVDTGNYNTGRGGHYYNGCYDSVKNPVNSACVAPNCVYTHTWISNAHATWTGCFMDRTQSNDVTNTTPVIGTPATLFPAENNAYCPPAPLLPIAYNWTALSNAVNAMTANGSTNQPVGLAWGWQSLSQGSPLNAPAVDNQTTQVIILLSDGLNTQDRWNGNGVNQSAQVDAREALVCSNAKAAGVVIYTLFVDLGGTTGSSAALQNCATDSSKYFDLTTSGQIVTAFNQIGTQLANLHLAR